MTCKSNEHCAKASKAIQQLPALDSAEGCTSKEEAPLSAEELALSRALCWVALFKRFKQVQDVLPLCWRGLLTSRGIGYGPQHCSLSCRDSEGICMPGPQTVCIEVSTCDKK